MAGEAVARKQEPAAAAPAQKSNDVSVDLDKPVMANGEMVKKITFREPTGGDIMSLGDDFPINIDWATGRVTPNPKPMGDMMSVLAAVPPSTIKALSANDWSTCAHALMGFFTPGAQAMQS
jgi:hypothetical protein